jgi:hypothetical protein
MSEGSRLGIPLEKRTLNLYEGDFDALTQLFPGAHKSHTLRHVLRSVIKAEALRQGIQLKHIARQEAQKPKEVEF